MTIEKTPGEQKADEAILACMDAIINMDGEKLAYNTEELCEAIHVLQSFTKQHVLNRLDPVAYSRWWHYE